MAVGVNPVEAMLGADEASTRLGIELLEHSTGSAVLRMTVTPAMVNGHRIAHGGYLFLLADTAFACACNSHGPVTVAAARRSPSSHRCSRATCWWPPPRSGSGSAAAGSTT